MKTFKLCCAAIFLCLLSTQSFASLPSLAVIDFKKMPSENNSFISITQDNATIVVNKNQTINPILAMEVTRYLSNSHKFDVLDRTHISMILREQEFTKMDFASTKTLGKTGQLLGADYLVTGIIERSDISTKKYTIPYTNKEQTLRIGDMQINVTVIDSRTGKVVASVPTLVHKQIVLDENKSVSKKEFELQLIVDAAKTISTSIINAVFPPRIMQIDGNTVYINRGEASDFGIDDVLTVYNKGEPLTDPDTGRTVGFTKSRLGTVNVSNINTQYTVAKVLTGDPASFTNTIVVKEAQAKPATKIRPPTTGSSDKPLTW